MSLEYCSKCGCMLLTEVCEYVVTPREAHALTCMRCVDCRQLGILNRLRIAENSLASIKLLVDCMIDSGTVDAIKHNISKYKDQFPVKLVDELITDARILSEDQRGFYKEIAREVYQKLDFEQGCAPVESTSFIEGFIQGCVYKKGE